jgi:hypothetical protein
MEVLLYGLICACLGLTACESAEESRARADARRDRDTSWCVKQSVKAAADLEQRGYNPTIEERKDGHIAFMRECMRKLGY